MAERGSKQEFPAFGRLTYDTQYGESWWSGEVKLAAFDKPFPVLVRAKGDGPSQAQTIAFSRIIAGSEDLRRRASKPMADLHREGGLLPGGADARDEAVWNHLVPEQIEMSDERYYRDGRIMGALLFVSTLHDSFVPAIETADGEFVRVLSGT
ncbi:hypothetical protein [Plastoroseomonas hellenica]|uniref:hypothetical protein n=1 Tax=Plastoroseomonas hellenica TaxID=2687306 RepID=UPI001BACAF55|nr:hypothetical protein [Plastoroseomonas hellenica]MBR0644865.1 hypothetical protein [Plastoroseomonas hellenica]